MLPTNVKSYYIISIMKLHFTFYLSILLSAFSLEAQTTYDIEAGGGGTGNPPAYYAPQFITIEVGDIVRWTNSGGTHNVDATLATFPTNPEGFTSGATSSVLWVFEHTFTLPGEYEFECAAFDHNETQFGTITVMSSGVGFDEYQSLDVDIYPNPTTDYLNVYMSEVILQVDILSLDLKHVMSVLVHGSEREILMDIEALIPGSYFLQVTTDSGKAIRRFLKN